MLYSGVNLWTVLGFILVVGTVIGISEVTRRYFKAAIFFYMVLPVLVPILVFTGIIPLSDSSAYWFPWVKHYSALAGVLGFMYIRYKKDVINTKFAIIFPALIVTINIIEAVYRDIECFLSGGGIENGLVIISGPWNIINAIAGILCIVTITGYKKVFVSKQKSKDMILPDMLSFWIIAYSLWNFSYVYNCIGNRSLYAGGALLIAAMIQAFWIKKGAWLQHRAHTLAAYTLFVIVCPYFAESSVFAVDSVNSETALLVVSLFSLLSNLGVLGFQIYTMKKQKINPYLDGGYQHLKEAQTIISLNQ